MVNSHTIGQIMWECKGCSEVCISKGSSKLDCFCTCFLGSKLEESQRRFPQNGYLRSHVCAVGFYSFC